MNTVEKFNKKDLATALDKLSKAVVTLLSYIRTNHTDIEKSFQLIKKGRDSFITSYFSPKTNPKLFTDIINYNNKPEIMDVIVDLYNYQCYEEYFKRLKTENSGLSDKAKEKLFSLLANKLFGLKYENGNISSFIIEQSKHQRESMLNSEKSIQNKIDFIEYLITKSKSELKLLEKHLEDQQIASKDLT